MPAAPKRGKPAKTDGIIKKPVRVPRACDNCRLRKSKCDGLLPCSFCELHESDCTYDSSRPKKQLDTKYIVSLERTVDHLKALLGIPPEVEVDPEFLDSYTITRSLQQDGQTKSHLTSTEQVATQTSPPSLPGSPLPRTLLESMVEATGRLNIDEDGNYDYSGNCSGLLLVERIRERCDYLLERKHGDGHRPAQLQRSRSDTPRRAPSQPRPKARSLSTLPPWDVVARYLHVAFAEAFSLFNFIHRPAFESRIHVFYAARNAGLDLTFEDVRFEALLNALFALGELFSGAGYAEEEDHNRLARAEQYFNIAQQSLDLTECRDVISLQALLCLVIYLQGSAQLPSCYTYISLAMTAAIRMGLHRADSLSKFNPVERETRKRIFWSLRAMDSYITTVLDLPRSLSDEDTDQSYPLEIDDNLLVPQKIKSTPEHAICPMSSVNAHTRLGLILAKVKKIASGSDEGEQKPNSRYQVDYTKIVEAEHDLVEWTMKLPGYNKLPDPVPREIEKAQSLLQIAQGHVQMVLYRPFLHHIARRNSDTNFDYRAFACASACIKAAMQVIWLVEAMDEARLLNGPSWLLFFTLFMAVVSSTMFVITNKEDPSSQEYYSAAQRGFRVLERFSNSNLMARNYTESLRVGLQTIVMGWTFTDNQQPLFCESSTSRPGLVEGSELMVTTPSGVSVALPRPHALSKSPGLGLNRSPSSTIHQSNALNDVSLVGPEEPMNGTNSHPTSIFLPSPTLPPMEDAATRQVYLQAMNCTPPNFFEGFSSETAMMDYFAWHEQDIGPSNRGFPFQ